VKGRIAGLESDPAAGVGHMPHCAELQRMDRLRLPYGGEGGSGAIATNLAEMQKARLRSRRARFRHRMP
jgi:hypothetical protein